MAVEYNAYVPSPEEMQRRALRADGNFIGTGMLFLVALSQFLYTIVVLGLVFFHVIPYAYVGLNDLGLGNTSYLLLYMGVYIVMMGAPLPVAALIQRRRIQPFGPAKGCTRWRSPAGCWAAWPCVWWPTSSPAIS